MKQLAKKIWICLIICVLALLCGAAALAAEDESWRALYAQYLSAAITADEKAVCEMLLLADLDFDGTPELLHGITDGVTGETRAQVSTISDGRVTVLGSYPLGFRLSAVRMNIKRVGSNYHYLMTMKGQSGQAGQRQIRYCVVSYRDGQLKAVNRFTKRYRAGGKQFYVNGSQVSEHYYDVKWNNFTKKLSQVGETLPLKRLRGKLDARALGAEFESLARLYEDFSALTSLSLNRTSLKLRLDRNAQLSAVVKPATAIAQQLSARFSTSDPDIATVDESGQVTATGYGTAIITATLANGASTQCTVNVPRPAVTRVRVSAQSRTLKKGQVMTLKATLYPDAARGTLKWTSSDPSVVNVDANSGQAVALKRGSARITCTSANGKRGSVLLRVVHAELVSSIALSQDECALQVGEGVALSAQVLPVEAPNQALTWYSSNSFVATVNAAGYVRARSAGTAVITARALGGAWASMRVTVTARAGAPGAGVYVLALARHSDRALSLNAAGVLALSGLESGACFSLIPAQEGAYEIRAMDGRYVCHALYGGEEQPRLVSGASGESRLWRIEPLSSGAYTIHPFSGENQALALGFSSTQLGLRAGLIDANASATAGRFILMRAGGAPQKAQWAACYQAYLAQNAAEAAQWQRLALCDLDGNGTPELVAYTGQLYRCEDIAATGLRGFVYAYDGNARLERDFSYPEAGHAALGDAWARLRPATEAASGARVALLSGATLDGEQSIWRLSFRDGLIQTEPLFSCKGQSAAGAAQGSSPSACKIEGKDATAYAYTQAFDALGESYLDLDGALFELDTAGLSAGELARRFEALCQSYCARAATGRAG